MSFSVTCKKCNKSLTAEDSWVGQTSKCPFCEATIIIEKPSKNIVTNTVNLINGSSIIESKVLEKVKAFLVLFAIVGFPWVFSWLTLKEKYSLKERVFAFGWMLVITTTIISTVYFATARNSKEISSISNTSSYKKQDKNYRYKITENNTAGTKSQLDIDIDTTSLGAPNEGDLLRLSQEILNQTGTHNKKNWIAYKRYFFNYFLGMPSKYKQVYAIYSQEVGFRSEITIIYDVEKSNKNGSQPKYTDLKKLSNALLDCNIENKRLKIIKTKGTVHLQVSPLCFKGESKRVVIENGRREIIYTLIALLTSSDYNEFKIDAVPLDMKKWTKNRFKYLKNKKVSLSVSRKKAEKTIRALLKISTLNELIGDEFSAVKINFKANGLLFNDQGGPTLNTLWNKLQR